MKPMALPPSPGAPVAVELELGPDPAPDETLLEQAAPSRATTALNAHTTLRALMPEVPPPVFCCCCGGWLPLSDRCVGEGADQAFRCGVQPLAGQEHQHQDRDDVGQGVEGELVQGVAPGLQRRREREGGAEKEIGRASW